MSGFISKRKMGRDKMGPWGNELSDVLQSPLSDDWGLHKARNWKLKLCVTPKKCFLSGKSLWGKRAYHGIRLINGPGDTIQEDYWIEKNEFIIWNLKGRT